MLLNQVNNEIQERANSGPHALGFRTACCACSRPIASDPRYVVRIATSSKLPVPGFYYYCCACGQQETKDAIHDS
jgi:hypothetical protein